MLRLLRVYLDQFRMARAAGERLGIVTAARDLRRWLASQAGGSGLNERAPWITFAARRHLERVIGPEDRIFEYGSGGSTLFLAHRAASVVAIEHDPDWHAHVSARLGLVAQRVQLTCIPPNVVHDDRGHHGHERGHLSTGQEFTGRAFCEYASSIDQYPDGSFDVILIDGRARPACFEHAKTKVRSGGSIVLDNSERPEYTSIIRGATEFGWQEQRYFGPGPYVREFWATTIWTVV